MARVRERAQKILDAGKSAGWTLAMLKALPKGTPAEEQWLSGYMEGLALAAALGRRKFSEGKESKPTE